MVCKQKEQKPVECVTDAEMKKGLDELTQFKCFASALSDMYNIIPSHSSLRPKDIDWNNFCAGLLTYLKRVQPAEWSEEDEKKRKGLIEGLEKRMGFGWASDPFSREEYISFLKSLRPQPHTVSIKNATKFGNLEYERGVKDGIQHAKNHQWKPSEEQMTALDGCLENWTGNKYQKEFLESLYEQLKKL